ncbi:hypothetical protein BV25DRAFT_1826733, partial [Artomyces pyxidatus]
MGPRTTPSFSSLYEKRPTGDLTVKPFESVPNPLPQTPKPTGSSSVPRDTSPSGNCGTRLSSTCNGVPSGPSVPSNAPNARTAYLLFQYSMNAVGGQSGAPPGHGGMTKNSFTPSMLLLAHWRNCATVHSLFHPL